MIRRILVPAGEKTPALKLMQKIAGSVDHPVEFVIGFIETPDLAGERRISIVDYLINEIGRGRTSDLNCRLARVKHDAVLDGVIELAKREQADMVALHIPSSQPELERVDVWNALAERSLQCSVQVFNLGEVVSSTA